MVYQGSEFYEDPKIFAEYWKRRVRKESANAVLEGPVFTELVGDVRGLRVLDLGCGDASCGVELLARGAASYVGVDGSAKMVEKARELLRESGLYQEEAPAGRIEVVHQDIRNLEFAPGQFDLVVSRLALHYLEDLAAVLHRVRELLAPGGRLVFSVEHPAILSCSASLEESARRGSWIVDDYFLSGPRQQPWLGGEVVKYHRTIEEYFALVQAAGFTVESLRESKPVRERFDSEGEYLRRARIPLFLFLAGRK
ncbi:class I SAM-dependent DNA methyltransferase [Tumebacillus flagellatus]|uniref:Methyltransferase n=1 Tax=Tumebacillus flagellatus TaxID=1157490 RepID=A0A074LK63_9BACL|nr:class I SAM-dependent methyltransferase [Tumebacillus flagellatus]KEO80990.1 methyltransferase [Tumebacillus flagellatus]